MVTLQYSSIITAHFGFRKNFRTNTTTTKINRLKNKLLLE